MSCLKGPHGKVKAGCRQRQNVGHMPLLGSMSGVHWGSWGKVRLVYRNQKSRGFRKPHRGLI